MKLESLVVPKSVEEQSDLLVRAMSVGWTFQRECSGDNDAEAWFNGKITPPDWIDEKFDTYFNYDENQEIEGVSVIEIMTRACEYIVDCYNQIANELEEKTDFWQRCATDIKGVRLRETQKEEKICNQEEKTTDAG